MSLDSPLPWRNANLVDLASAVEKISRLLPRCVHCHVPITTAKIVFEFWPFKDARKN